MEKHVFAIDWSLSIESVVGYYNFVKKLINGHKGRVLDVILWAENAIHFDVKRSIHDINALLDNKNDHFDRRATKPFAFVALLNYSKNEPYHLHIVTDGEVYDKDVDLCDQYMTMSDIFENILSVKLYFMGENRMNTKLKNLFPHHLLSIQINGKTVSELVPTMPLNDITYDFIMKDDSIYTWVLMQLRAHPSDLEKAQLRSALTRKMHDLIRCRQMEESVLESFFKARQIDDCVAYVRTHSYNAPKARIQSKMAHIWKLLEGSICPDALEALHPTEQPSVPVTIDEEDLEEMPITCDILLNNIKVPCFPVQQNKRLTCTPGEARVLGRNPFDAFSFVEQNLHLVEPHFLNYSVTQQFQRGNLSPFTRVHLKGYYLLPNTKDDRNFDFASLMKHNDYVLSTLFVDKLPGVRILWHIVFLYTLALKKEAFSEHRELFFDAIRYLSEHSWYYVAFNPHDEPTFYEKLKVCFWYTAEICQRAFPNSPKNKYKSWENVEGFLQFYKDVFDPTFEMPLIAAIWWGWKYMYSPFTKKSPVKVVLPPCVGKLQTQEEETSDVTQKTEKKPAKAKGNKAKKSIVRKTPSTFDITHLLTHFYGHKDYKNTKETVLFSDLPVTPPAVKPLTWPQRLGLETVMKLCRAYLTKLGGLSYEEFDIDLGRDHTYSLKVYGPYSEQMKNKMRHVSINPITCRPYVQCRNSHRHWKACAGVYDVPTESSFRMFQRYCEKKKKYPTSTEDLMSYKKERLMWMYEEYPIFHTTHEDCFQIVIDSFKNITQAIPVEEYLARCKKYQLETSRLRAENFLY